MWARVWKRGLAALRLAAQKVKMKDRRRWDKSKGPAATAAYQEAIANARFQQKDPRDADYRLWLYKNGDRESGSSRDARNFAEEYHLVAEFYSSGESLVDHSTLTLDLDDVEDEVPEDMIEAFTAAATEWPTEPPQLFTKRPASYPRVFKNYKGAGYYVLHASRPDEKSQRLLCLRDDTVLRAYDYFPATADGLRREKLVLDALQDCQYSNEKEVVEAVGKAIS